MVHQYGEVAVGGKVKLSCSRCGSCCHGPNVSLTAFDVCRVAEFLGLHWGELKGRYVAAVIADMVAIPVLASRGGLCAFLEFNDKPYCRVYPARPMRCRLYPFIPYSPGRQDLINLDYCCRGVGFGEVIEPPWELLSSYYQEVKYHYSKLNSLIFEGGYEPLKALEILIDEVYEERRTREGLGHLHGSARIDAVNF
ncbi:MAG: YkgJ family cysteine cluster protein [Candidatus Nezhaarchaeota archaeon]|nr:YkgJ family cysteine cluster protein [Candidatus Nezhaarchaeota archaeon]